MKIKKNIKAEGLSLNMVVIAALAIFVLVVMMIIFANKARPAADFYGDCSKLNGQVMDQDQPCPEDKPIASPFVKEKDKKCCIKEEDLVP